MAMSSSAGILKPDELHKLSDEIELRKLQEALHQKRSMEDEQRKLHDEFMARELRPDVHELLNATLKRAAEAGVREIQVMKFPASFCTDKGRAINNFEPDWADSLDGWAKRAHDFFKTELEPQGFKVRAQILNYPDGVPGDVGIYLSW
jgi:hypothetical protein